MKDNLLIYTSTSPPKKSAGSFRISNICKSLCDEYNIDILTHSKGTLIKHYDKEFRVSINKRYSTFLFNSYCRNRFIKKITRKINSLPIILFLCGYFKLKKIINKYSLIICSAPNYGYILPIILFKNKYILDMRDLWTKDERKNDNCILKYLEDRLLRNANKIIVASPYMIKYIPKYSDKIIIINNAYTLYRNKIKYSEKEYHYDFAYTGVVYARREEMALKFIEKFYENKIVIAGALNENFKKKIKKNKNVSLMGIVNYNISLALQDSSKYLLALAELDWTIPAKVYDYMSMKKPVLGLGYDGDSALKEIIDETGIGIYLPIEKFNKMEKSEIEERLSKSYNPNYSAINKFGIVSFKRKFKKVVMDELQTETI